MKASRWVRSAAVAIACIAVGGSARADITTTNPTLPPLDGVYISATDVHTIYNVPGLIEVLLARPEHAAVAVRERFTIPPNDEMETFDSTMNGAGTVTGAEGNPLGLPGGVPIPVTFNSAGPVQTVVHGKVGNVTGSFDTEMLSMSLSGASALGPFMIRESPTLPSLGHTTITDIGGGMYHIDSFFDVFTELSIDGGASWIPSSGPTHVELVPEPTSLSLLGLGAVALGGLWRRSRRAA